MKETKVSFQDALRSWKNMVDKWVMATKETIVSEATPESINSVVLNEHQGLALHYPSPITGFSSGVGGFWGINCDDDEEHDGVSD
ncbi:hypothetical protein Tco_1283678 [Tanacetum coccineum]